MSSIEIRQAVSEREKRLFALFPWRIYKDDPLWVPPLLAERKKAMDVKQGVFFQRGYAEFFLAWRDGKPVGTICAAEDVKGNQAVNKRDCLFGFFDCINDYAVAEALFNHVRDWALAHNLDALYGPFNLDYEDSYGILIEGRNRPPAILCGHTAEYYLPFLERYDFQPARGDNLAYAITLDPQSPQIQDLMRMAERVQVRRQFTIRSADLAQWEQEINKVFVLINQALKHLPGHIPWRREALQKTLQPFVEIADEELVLFAEDNERVVGFFPAVPNINEILIHTNGLRYPWDYAKAWWYSKKQPKCAAVKSVLVLPEYWGSGVAIVLFAEMAKRVMRKGYEWADLSLTSDDNPRTPVLAERMGAEVYKRYRVFRLPIC